MLLVEAHVFLKEVPLIEVQLGRALVEARLLHAGEVQAEAQ